jgi:hypothetical protein
VDQRLFTAHPAIRLGTDRRFESID